MNRRHFLRAALGVAAWGMMGLERALGGGAEPEGVQAVPAASWVSVYEVFIPQTGELYRFGPS